MKELSIEEKAKRYDERLAKARKKYSIHKANNAIGIMDALERVFPELKESEGERIRKTLSAYFAKFKPNDMWDADFSFGDIVAWLEKQGNLMKALQISNAEIGELIEKNYYLKEQLEKQGNNMGISETTKKELEDNLNRALAKETPESWNKFLEEQGEQKPVFEMKTPEESLGIDSETYSKIVDECVYGEQKPADNQFTPEQAGVLDKHIDKFLNQKLSDKVEPKFKIEEGKWYVCTQTYVLRGKIVVIKGQTYQAEKDNVIRGEDGCLFIDRHDGKALDYFRLWTIQDAKAGDVLATKAGGILIYKELLYDKPFAYCGVDKFGVFKDCNCGDGLDWTPYLSDVTPATKEQRDTLMKAMADAGYEWDAENRQLRKIESRQEELTEFEKAVKQVMEEAIECGDTHNLKADADLLLRLVQKPWSEEDEKIYTATIFALAGFMGNEDKLEWLKSIKERYAWKPSDEQMEALEHFVRSIGESGYASPYDNDTKLLYSLLFDLKKLREK